MHRGLMSVANWTRAAGHHVMHTDVDANTPVAMYVKPEVETPPESTEVLVLGNSQPTDAMTTGGSGVGDGNSATDDARTTWTSPYVDRRTAAVQRRLAETAAAGGSAYKYKDNIKRRFCSEGDAQAPFVDTRTYSGSSGDCSTPPSSPATVPAVTSSGPRQMTVTSTTQRSPGFVLHPSGAYYVPVMAATAQVRVLAAHASSPEGAEVVCHPVSIPVRFSGSATTADVVRVDDEAHQPVQCQSLLQLQQL